MWHKVRAEILERKWWTKKLSRDGGVRNIRMKDLCESLGGESTEKQEWLIFNKALMETTG